MRYIRIAYILYTIYNIFNLPLFYTYIYTYIYTNLYIGYYFGSNYANWQICKRNIGVLLCTLYIIFFFYFNWISLWPGAHVIRLYNTLACTYVQFKTHIYFWVDFSRVLLIWHSRFCTPAAANHERGDSQWYIFNMCIVSYI